MATIVRIIIIKSNSSRNNNDNNTRPYLVGELERQQLESVGVFLPQDDSLCGLVPAPVELLVEHHLAHDGVGLALLHVEHLAQGRQAEGLVVRRVREEVGPQCLRLIFCLV